MMMGVLLASCRTGNPESRMDAGSESGSKDSGNLGGDADTDGDIDADIDADIDGDSDGDSDGNSDAAIPDGGEDACACDPDAAGQPGWTRTMGGSEHDSVSAVAVGSDGTVVIAGNFQGTVDFDPGEGEDMHTSSDGSAFLSKYTSKGGYLWTRVIDGTFMPSPKCLEVMDDGSIILGGDFLDTIDLDPGDGVAERTSNGGLDIGIIKLDGHGDFLWGQTVGGTGDDSLSDLEIRGDSVIVLTGKFSFTVDFDPGPSSSEQTSAGLDDVFVFWLDTDGNCVSSLSLGGSGSDKSFGMALGNDGSIALTGTFEHTIDLDPGPGTAEHTAAGTSDIFFLKLSPVGAYEWSYSFGNEALGYDSTSWGESAAVDDEGNIYFGGQYCGDIDFDPTGKEEWHGDLPRGAFITKYTASGAYEWTETLSGISINDIRLAAGGVAATGVFSGPVDFDPGPGVEERDPGEGCGSLFDLSLKEDGTFHWVTFVGCAEILWSCSLSQGPDLSLYTVGYFLGTMDFNPTDCVENHSSYSPATYDGFIWKLDSEGSYSSCH